MGILPFGMADLLAAHHIRDVPDFPKEGILFKDITPVLQEPAALRQVVELLAEDAREKGAEVIVGIESRGFLFGVPIAMQLGLPFSMARKLGKLPYDRINHGNRVYVVDDLLATGGTAAASARLIERLNANVCGFGFMVELTFLNGRRLLAGYPVKALIEY
jgi:adenine phosphoribosyltransferase